MMLSVGDLSLLEQGLRLEEIELQVDAARRVASQELNIRSASR